MGSRRPRPKRPLLKHSSHHRGVALDVVDVVQSAGVEVDLIELGEAGATGAAPLLDRVIGRVLALDDGIDEARAVDEAVGVAEEGGAAGALLGWAEAVVGVERDVAPEGVSDVPRGWSGGGEVPVDDGNGFAVPEDGVPGRDVVVTDDRAGGRGADGHGPPC